MLFVISVKSFARATAEISISIAPMIDFLYSKSALIFAYTSASLCVKSMTSGVLGMYQGHLYLLVYIEIFLHQSIIQPH